MLKMTNYTDEWHRLVYCQLDSAKNNDCTTIGCYILLLRIQGKIFQHDLCCQVKLICYVYEDYKRQNILIFTTRAQGLCSKH